MLLWKVHAIWQVSSKMGCYKKSVNVDKSMTSRLQESYIYMDVINVQRLRYELYDSKKWSCWSIWRAVSYSMSWKLEKYSKYFHLQGVYFLNHLKIERKHNKRRVQELDQYNPSILWKSIERTHMVSERIINWWVAFKIMWRWLNLIYSTKDEIFERMKIW